MNHEIRLLKQTPSGILCLSVFTIAVTAIVGWWLDQPIMASAGRNMPVMQPMTAIGLIMAASTIPFLRSDNPTLRALLFAMSAVICGAGILLILVQAMDGRHVLQELLPRLAAFWHRFGRLPSPPTALNFMLLGSALMLRTLKRLPITAQTLALTSGANAVIVLTGFVFSNPEFIGFPFFHGQTGMAINTAVSCILLTVAFLLTTPFLGVMSLIMSTTRSGKVARQIFLAVFILPPILGYLTGVGTKKDLYGGNAHVSLFVISYTLILLVLAWRVIKRSEQEEIQSNALFKEAEKARDDLHQVLESAHDGVILVNESGGIQFSNRRITSWFGYSPDELLGQPVEILIPERYTEHAKLRKTYFSAPRSRPMGRYNLNLTARRRDGSEFPVDIALSPSQTSKGMIVTAVVRDISEQKKRQSHLQFLSEMAKMIAASIDYEGTAAKTAQVIVNQVADGCVIQIFENGRITVAAADHRNQDRQKLFQDIARRLNNTQLPVQGAFDNYFAANANYSSPSDQDSQHAILSDQVLRQLIDAEFALVSFVTVPLKIPGRIVGSISFVSDESHRLFDKTDVAFFESVGKQVALAIENARIFRESQRAIQGRDHILATVSHDLRNPMSLILMASEILRNKLPDGWDGSLLTEMTGKISDSCRMMMKMVEDLLDRVAIEAGEVQVRPEPTSLKYLLERVQKAFQDLAQQKQVRFRVAVPVKDSVVFCDADRLTQVFSNLIGNALKFSRPGDSLDVTCALDEGFAVFRVADSGPGIAQEHQERLFERFWQIPGTLQRGSGLGLYIAKSIVEAHDGRIWVRSELHRGATFFFSAPLPPMGLSTFEPMTEALDTAGFHKEATHQLQ